VLATVLPLIAQTRRAAAKCQLNCREPEVPCGECDYNWLTCVILLTSLADALPKCRSSNVVAQLKGFRLVRLFVFARCRWPWLMYACIGVAVGLLLVAVLFLIVATVSAKFTASRPFVSSRQLRCLRATNCMVRSCCVHARIPHQITGLVTSTHRTATCTSTCRPTKI